jgi:hypothetical protein
MTTMTSIGLIREGVPRDGRTFWFMPVEAFQF